MRVMWIAALGAATIVLLAGVLIPFLLWHVMAPERALEVGEILPIAVISGLGVSSLTALKGIFFSVMRNRGQ